MGVVITKKPLIREWNIWKFVIFRSPLKDPEFVEMNSIWDNGATYLTGNVNGCTIIKQTPYETKMNQIENINALKQQNVVVYQDSRKDGSLLCLAKSIYK